MKHRHSRALALTIASVGLAGFCFNVAAFYPGLISSDSGDQYLQAVHHSFSDWHPVFMALLWSWMLKVLPGALGMLILISAGIWGGATCFAWELRHRWGWPSLLCFAVPLLPVCLNFSGLVWKDVLHAAFWWAAAGLLFRSRSFAARSGKRASWSLTAGIILILCGVLVRPNGIFAATPLLMWALHRRSIWTTLVGTLVCLAGVVALSTALSVALNVERTHAVSSVEVYGLGGMSYYTGENLLPGRWSAQQSRMLVENCYRPHAWDNYSWSTGRPLDDCQFVSTALRDQQLWGSKLLMTTWVTEIARHPAAFLRSRLASYQYFLKTPGLRTFLDSPNTISAGNIVPARLNALARRINRYTTFGVGLAASVPIYWSAVCAACLLALGFLWERSSSCGKYAFVLACSAALYSLTYFPIGVASDLRYFYWCYIAIALAVILGFAEFSTKRRASGHTNQASTGLKFIAVTLATGLIFTAHFPANWLMSTAPISISATGERNPAATSSDVCLQQVRDADGGVTAGALSGHWTFTDGAWCSTGYPADTITWQDQGSGVAATLAFRSHSQSGIVRVQSSGFDETFDLYSPSPAWKDVTVPLVRRDTAPNVYLLSFLGLLCVNILVLLWLGTRLFGDGRGSR
ncbi:hypothetical protein AWB70_06921 [Caballeronia cordobensis]|uniref:Uncharacterized protein n=1 Tax=Caballeronia cordobensis TaxID=1353886 RepID=A0A158JKN7_CABCO|nr:hypothetical protein [Caballeronia cordobensis]SAL69358.1 hypothetical protein AWB70_06921 [Caballeronia cordobensis]